MFSSPWSSTITIDGPNLSAPRAITISPDPHNYTFLNTFLNDIWTLLSPRATQSLVKLTIPEDLIFEIFSSIGENRIRELVIVLWTYGHFDKWLNEHQNAAQPRFPELESLTLAFDDHYCTEVLVNTDVSKLAKKLASAHVIRRNRRIRQLEIHDLVFKGCESSNQAAWHSIALQVSHYRRGNALEQTTSHAFHEQLLHEPSLRGNAAAVHDIAAAILKTVQMVLSAALREVNRENMLYSELPREIWSRIWENLSTDDCLAVSQVCRDWRETAWSWPKLWTHIEYRFTCTGEENRPVTKTNVDRLEHYIERSAPLALDVSIKLEQHEETGIDGYWYVRDCHDLLKAHAARIGSIRVDGDSMSGMSEILNGLKSLPLLKKLIINSQRFSWNDFRRQSFDGEYVCPILEEVHVGGTDLALSAPHFKLTAPRLRNVESRLRVWFDTFKLLSAGPLQSLTMTMEPTFFPPSPFQWEEIRRGTPRSLRRICLRDVPSSEAENVMNAFYRSDLLSFRIRLAEDSAQSIMTAIFCDIGYPTAVTFLKDVDNCDEITVGNHAKERRITISTGFNVVQNLPQDPIISQTWTLLPPNARHTTEKLTVHSKLIQAALLDIGQNSIRQVIIIVGIQTDLVQQLDEHLSQEQRAHFSEIECLTLEGEIGQQETTIDVAKLTEKLHAALGLLDGQLIPRVNIRGVSFAGKKDENNTKWMLLAENVTYS
ncbi:hypothetical protein BKA62DRAFT_769303 [Auriculariales sp. MPI-PUGE-AT-0066]|nr:hypothetical protein BKA62DRAFT_769303 [Auriculariales sp. MPI-PUGE-AT-0066]